MRTTLSHWTGRAALLSLGALSACAEPPEYVYGDRVTDLAFTLCDPEMGIHPSRAALACEGNPFARGGVGAETKWRVESAGGPVAAFYAWATVLAAEPTGEHQFYAASNLARIYRGALADQDDLETVREMAITAFQTVLDSFPESVSYDATGTVAFRLATPAYRGIVDLGAVPNGGWVLVATADAGEQAVRIGQTVPVEAEAP